MGASRYFALTSLLLAMTSIASASPKIGDKAPTVKVAKWMKDTPPALPGAKDAEKHVFLVEFWATWCGPCKTSIPHLSELQQKYGKDGLVVIGVSNEDPETISAFMNKKNKGQALEMSYFVAADDEMATNNGYMEGIPGIPHAFLVNKAGQIVWTGNPLNPAMNGVLEKVMAGKYDVETAKKSAEADKKFADLSTQLQPAYQARDKDKLLKVLDEMISTKPAEVQPWMIKRQMYTEFEMADKIPALEIEMEKAFADSPSALMELATALLSRDVEERNPQLIYRSASRAADLSAKDPDAQELLARVQCEFGMLDAAISTQQKAIAASNGKEKERNEKVLAYYNTLKKLKTTG